MDNLGIWLQSTRENKGISLPEVESITRIRTRYLEALETGDYGSVPGGEAQVRGFLRRYSAFLGLSPEEAVTRYNQEVHGYNPETRLPAPRPTNPEISAAMMGIPPKRRRYWPLAAALAIIAILIPVSWWLWGRGASPPSETTPPLTTREPIAVESPVTDIQATPAPEPTQTFVAAEGNDVTLMLEPQEHVWVRVSVDGFIVFEGMMSPGDTPTWTGQEMVTVETGNGAAIIAIVNDQPQGYVGGRGEVSARAWGPAGELDVPVLAEAIQ